MIQVWVNMMIVSMLFFPTKELTFQPKDFGLAYEEAWCQTEDGVKIHGWFLEAKGSDACLLFFHGNADNISSRLPKAKEWVERGVSVLLAGYRGYGKSEGEIKTGEDIYRDARAALNWLKGNKNYPPQNIILYGESIGAQPAVDLAAQEAFKAIILEAPFTNLKEIAKHHYGMAPDFLLKDFPLDNESKMPQLKSPVLIVHGTEDEVVPFAMGKRLFDRAPEPKQFFEIAGAHHNDITEVGGSDFFDRPFRFAMRK
ncbi:MAG: alpha/beta hydrolase [Candidatus Omnitrophica bacterium]|nr:alpha/beta hydrolase [Candidatus Omnitrophota bacterium]